MTRGDLKNYLVKTTNSLTETKLNKTGKKEIGHDVLLCCSVGSMYGIKPKGPGFESG